MATIKDVIRTIPDKKYQLISSDILENGMYPAYTQKFIEKKYTNNKEKVFFNTPAILFADHAGRFFYAQEPFSINCDGLKIIKLVNNTDSLHYLYYYLNSIYKTDGKYRRHFSDLKLIPVSFPERKIQNKIVSILSPIDIQIKNNFRMIEKAEMIIMTIFNYWFVQFNYPNGKGQPYKTNGGPMTKNDLLKTQIPSGWKVVELKDLIIKASKSKVQVSSALKTTTNVPFFTSGDEILFAKEHMVDGLNLFMSTGGNASIKYFNGKSSYSTDTFSITAGKFTAYLYCFINSLINKIDDWYFAGSGLKHLQKDAFGLIKIAIPDDKTIEKFNNKVLPLFKFNSIKFIDNLKLTSLRDSLLPLLMTGKVNLNDN